MVEPKIHLTFAQIAWMIGIMAAVLISWGDIRTQLARIEMRQTGIEQTQADIYLRLRRLESVVPIH